MPARDRDDVVHDVLLAVFLAFSRYDPRRCLDAWVKTIARRAARDYGARRCNRELLLSAVGRRRVCVSPGADDLLNAEEQRRRLVAILGCSWAALEDLDGLTQVELAALLAVPPSTVQSRLRRMRAALREELPARMAMEAT